MSLFEKKNDYLLGINCNFDEVGYGKSLRGSKSNTLLVRTTQVKEWLIVVQTTPHLASFEGNDWRNISPFKSSFNCFCIAGMASSINAQ